MLTYDRNEVIEIRNLNNNKLYIKNENNAYILAGASSSGKTSILKYRLLNRNIHKVFSIDEIKELLIKSKKENILFKKFEEEYDYNINLIDNSNINQINDIHNFCIKHNLLNKKMRLFFSTQRKIKPTVFFDTTLRKINLINAILYYLKLGKYKYENIHLIWIFSTLDECISRNKFRKFKRDENTLYTEYKNVYKTINYIKNNKLIDNNNIYLYMNNDLY